jgi:hypothetical protein
MTAFELNVNMLNHTDFLRNPAKMRASSFQMGSSLILARVSLAKRSTVTVIAAYHGPR